MNLTQTTKIQKFYKNYHKFIWHELDVENCTLLFFEKYPSNTKKLGKGLLYTFGCQKS